MKEVYEIPEMEPVAVGDAIVMASGDGGISTMDPANPCNSDFSGSTCFPAD